MYQCFKDECSDLIFERKSVCERHIFEKHSGFGYKCTGCDKIFNRQENHQNRCLGAEMRLVKKSTRTFTSEEEEEYKQFLRDIPSLVKSTKRPPRTPKVRKDTRETNRKRSHSDNRENRYRGGESNKNKGFGRRGYSRGRDERRGVLEDLYDNKRQRFDERRVVSETVSRRTWNDKEESNEREAREERAESKGKEKEAKECIATVEQQNKDIEMERQKDITGKNGEKDDKNLEREGEKQIEDERQIIVREQAEQEDGRTEVPQLPPEWDALSLYTEGQIDEDEVEAAVQSLTAEMDKEDQLETGATSETAIPNETRSVCSENGTSGLVSPIPEYFPTDKKVLKLKKMAETQNKRIILNIGGTKFETSAPTLLNDPNCILAAMIKPDAQIKPYNIDNVYTYFIDRDPRHFHLILNYLRNELQMNIDRLPADPRHLKELEDECRYYEIKHLELLCTKRLLQIQEEKLLKMLTSTT